MKVSKEDIVGLVTAVEYWFEERDHTMERKHWRDDLDMIARKLGALHTFAKYLVIPHRTDTKPRAFG